MSRTPRRRTGGCQRLVLMTMNAWLATGCLVWASGVLLVTTVGPTKSAWAQIPGGPVKTQCGKCGKWFDGGSVPRHAPCYRDPPPPPPPSNTYGVVAIVNKTDRDVECRIRAYSGGGWVTETIKAGSGRSRSWRPASNFQVRFSSGGKTKEYRLVANVVRNREPKYEDGRKYYFSEHRGSLDLYNQPPPPSAKERASEMSRKAFAAYEKKDYKTALYYYEKAAELDPDNNRHYCNTLRLRNLLGIVAFEDDDLDQAESYFGKVTSVSVRLTTGGPMHTEDVKEQSALAFAWRGHIAMKREDWKTAAQLFKMALWYAPKDEDYQEFLKNAERKAAQEKQREEEERLGQLAADARERGRRATSNKDWALAVECFQKAQNYVPNDKATQDLLNKARQEQKAAVAREKGRKAMRDEDWAKAIDCFQESLDHGPGDKATLDLLAEARREQQNQEELVQRKQDFNEQAFNLRDALAQSTASDVTMPTVDAGMAEAFNLQDSIARSVAGMQAPSASGPLSEKEEWVKLKRRLARLRGGLDEQEDALFIWLAGPEYAASLVRGGYDPDSTESIEALIMIVEAMKIDAKTDKELARIEQFRKLARQWKDKKGFYLASRQALYQARSAELHVKIDHEFEMTLYRARNARSKEWSTEMDKLRAKLRPGETLTSRERDDQQFAAEMKVASTRVWESYQKREGEAQEWLEREHAKYSSDSPQTTHGSGGQLQQPGWSKSFSTRRTANRCTPTRGSSIGACSRTRKHPWRRRSRPTPMRARLSPITSCQFASGCGKT